MQDEVKVTQADRVAAADAVKAYRDSKNGDWQARIRRGECDDGYMVQAFARHRHQAERETLARMEPVGEAGPFAGSDGGFTTAVFHASKVPVGTKLYALPPAPEAGQ